MALIVIPNTFSAGAVIIASQHNLNFTTISSDYNGNIDNTNIAPGAAIVASKLDLTSPGAFGSTSPNIGKFTTLTTTGLASLNSVLVGSVHQGDVLYDNGTSLVRLTPGTTGQFLQTQGASANPQWATPSNTFSFVSKTSVSAVGTTGNISITNTNYYMVTFHLTTFDAAAILSIRFNADSGSNYKWVQRGFDFGATATNGNSTSDSNIKLIPSMNTNSSTSPIDGYFYIFPQETSNTTIFLSGKVMGRLDPSNVSAYIDVAGNYLPSPSAAITSFVVICGANMTGDFNLYQIKQS